RHGIQQPGEVEVGGVLRHAADFERAFDARRAVADRRTGRGVFCCRHVRPFGGIRLSGTDLVRVGSLRWPTSLLSCNSSSYLRKAPRRRSDQDFTSKMTSSSTGEPSGRLATPKTSREETASSPKRSRSNSDAASAIFGCSVNSGVAATYTPSLTTRLTRFSEPSCFLVSASALSAAVVAACRPAFTSRSLPTMPTIIAVWPEVA